jgi:hypothetical protein
VLLSDRRGLRNSLKHLSGRIYERHKKPPPSSEIPSYFTSEEDSLRQLSSVLNILFFNTTVEMKLSTRFVGLALFAGKAFSFENVTTDLSPVTSGSPSNSSIVPAANITLHYGQNDTSLVALVLHMNNVAVVLEDVVDISGVACSNSSTAVTFTSNAAFDFAVSEWSSSDDVLVFVTNHLGDCDAENERGFFLASSVSWDNSTLTVTASTEKTDVGSSACRSFKRLTYVFSIR